MSDHTKPWSVQQLLGNTRVTMLTEAVFVHVLLGVHMCQETDMPLSGKHTAASFHQPPAYDAHAHACTVNVAVQANAIAQSG